MKNLFSLVVFSLFFSLCANGQITPVEGTWRTLSMVTYKTEFDEDWGMDIEIPIVSPVAMKLNGTEIEVDGFIIPLTGKVKQSHLMLSALPQSMCFFCGGAGPESAMEVFMKDKKEVEYVPEKVRFRGTLRINAKDAASLLYSLDNAVIVEK